VVDWSAFADTLAAGERSFRMIPKRTRRPFCGGTWPSSTDSPETSRTCGRGGFVGCNAMERSLPPHVRFSSVRDVPRSRQSPRCCSLSQGPGDVSTVLVVLLGIRRQGTRQ
jgi:hypothetical protein